MKSNWLPVVLLISPLPIGFFSLYYYASLGSLSYLFALIWVMFWVWAGFIFSQLKLKKLHSFFFGNSLTIFFALLHFKVILGQGRVYFGLPGACYIWPLYPLTRLIMRNFISLHVWPTLFNSQDAFPVLAAYLLMILFFSVGFFWDGSPISQSPPRNSDLPYKL